MTSLNPGPGTTVSQLTWPVSPSWVMKEFLFLFPVLVFARASPVLLQFLSPSLSGGPWQGKCFKKSSSWRAPDPALSCKWSHLHFMTTGSPAYVGHKLKLINWCIPKRRWTHTCPRINISGTAALQHWVQQQSDFSRSYCYTQNLVYGPRGSTPYIYAYTVNNLLFIYLKS